MCALTKTKQRDNSHWHFMSGANGTLHMLAHRCIWISHVNMCSCVWLVDAHTRACAHHWQCDCVCVYVVLPFLGVSQAFSGLSSGRSRGSGRGMPAICLPFIISGYTRIVGYVWAGFTLWESVRVFPSRMPNSLWEIVMGIIHFHMCILIDSFDAPAQLLKIC